MQNMFCFCVQFVLSSRLEKGEMPEWSNGPHSKCGIRVTVSRVRIPVSPQKSKDYVQEGYPCGIPLFFNCTLYTRTLFQCYYLNKYAILDGIC